MADRKMIYLDDAINELKAMALPLNKDTGCEDIWERDRTLDNAIDAMRGLPSAQPEQQWIPCSERPPEEVGLYLVTLDYKEYGKCVTALWYHGKQVGWDLRVADVVTAWMPKPKPWKGEERRQDEE